MTITYALVDTVGDASIRTGDWAAELGPEGWDRVKLNDALGLSGFVNDRGFANPDTYPRNVVGSVLLMHLGAGMGPYAGPVVVTGWDLHAAPEVTSLTAFQAGVIDGLLTDIRCVLGMRDGELDQSSVWAGVVRQLADEVRTAPTPTLRITRISTLGGAL